MAKSKHVTQIVSANELMSGETVYRTHDGWSADIRAAVIAQDAGKAAALLALAEAEPDKAVGPYLVDVEIGVSGEPSPLDFRESMRVSGPSVGALNAPAPGLRTAA